MAHPLEQGSLLVAGWSCTKLGVGAASREPQAECPYHLGECRGVILRVCCLQLSFPWKRGFPGLGSGQKCGSLATFRCTFRVPGSQRDEAPPWHPAGDLESSRRRTSPCFGGSGPPWLRAAAPALRALAICCFLKGKSAEALAPLGGQT